MAFIVALLHALRNLARASYWDLSPCHSQLCGVRTRCRLSLGPGQMLAMVIR